MILIRIRIKVISWIRIRINLQIISQNFGKWAHFSIFSRFMSIYLEARFRIWNRIKVKGRIRTGMKVTKQDPDPNPHQNDKQDPDPHQCDADPPHCTQLF
jgi:hypothetical protein